MRCKDVERLMFNFYEEILDANTIEEIKHHTAECPTCAALEIDLEKIGTALQQIPIQQSSEELFEQTRVRCHAVLTKMLKARRKALRPSIPWWIWVAISALILLTGLLLLPLAGGIDLDQPLTFPKFGVVILVFQNLVMLFFAPLLLQRIRSPKNSYKNGFMSSGPSEA